MNILRKTLCVLCVAVILLSLSCLPATADTDNTVRNRKLVSVVYDDSGSMCNEKWEYTSYAMQCFAAMLNKEDTLDITYMSNYNTAFTVDTARRKESVEQIRNHDRSGGTPVESVDAAFNALKAHDDKNPNSQYWLIVITDGQMLGDEPVEDKINHIADTTMPNGTKPRIEYMTICDVSNSFTPSFAKSNVNVSPAKTAQQVLDVISEIACDISGRYAVDSKDIRYIDDKTVEVDADVPLSRIGILAQKSGATVTAITGTEKQKLTEESNLPVMLPGKYDAGMSDDEKSVLRGNVALYCHTGGNIAPDTYTITFSEPYSKENLVIMFEPAFELRIQVTVDGTVVKDLSSLVADQEVDIEAVLFETGTDNRILSSMLPSGAVSKITLQENGKEVTTKPSLKLKAVKLKSVLTTVTASLEIPGYFTVEDTVQFDPQAVKISGITAQLHYDGSERRKNDDGSVDPNNVVYITDLPKNETGIKFTLYIEGNPITKDQAIALKDRFADSLDLDFSNYKIDVCDDGGLVVSPTKTLTPDLIYWLIHRGDTTIKAEMDGQTASDILCFKIGDMKKAIIDFLIFLGIIFLIGYIIYWFFGKPHFKNGSIKLYITRRANTPFSFDYGNSPDVNYLTSSGPLNFFGPRGMRAKVGNFYIRKKKAGYVITGAKGLYIATNKHYPDSRNSRPCQQSTYHFATTIYVGDGTTYYKISM